MTQAIFDMLAEREQAVRTHADYLRVQIEQITGQLAELEAELSDLATTRKVLLGLDLGEAERGGPKSLPDNPAYQHILAALTGAGRPVRAKDLCQALDTGFEPKHIESMRSKLKRLVSLGLITETEPGLFALHHQ